DGPHPLDGRGFRLLYPDEMPLWDKMKTIATQIYGAEDIIADQRIRDQFKELQAQGHGNLPICVAKTQYSFSTDRNFRGAPSGHVVPIREVRLSAGAGFVVVICGEIMTMPGLPKSPSAERLRIDAGRRTDGLFRPPRAWRTRLSAWCKGRLWCRREDKDRRSLPGGRPGEARACRDGRRRRAASRRPRRRSGSRWCPTSR